MGNPALRIKEWMKRWIINDEWMERWIINDEWMKRWIKNDEWMKLWMLFSAEDMWEF